MRMILAVTPLLLLAACNVDKDGNTVTVQYDQNTAEEAAGDVANTAKSVGGQIANEVETAGDKAQNAGAQVRDEVGNVDVDVDVNRNGPADAGNSN
jgi:hypothetical protein